MGRPSDYSQEVVAAICERLADGESLRAICASDDMPGKSTVFQWLAAHKEFADQYARARETQADALFDEILSIADDVSRDTIAGKNGESIANNEWISRSRLRVDARKWMAGKLRPKVYGDKVQTELTGPEGGPVQFAEIRRVVVDPANPNR